MEILKEQAGEGLCPYDPHHNSTAVFAEDNLYVATVAQFSGADPLIYRSPLRTEQFNPKHLNQPNFVSSMHHEDHVYFFLRETAVEYINCGKRVYSRVARVCTKDKGGPHKFKNHWTSFVKARLNCSIPGDFPFYFDEIREFKLLLFLLLLHQQHNYSRRLPFFPFPSEETFVSPSSLVYSFSEIEKETVSLG
jgi:semaphorin 6